MRTISSVIVILAAGIAIGDEPRARLHKQGPLRVEEFHGKRRGEPDEFRAYTETMLRYNYRSRLRTVDGTTTAWLTKVEVYATFLPKQSWWDDERDNRRLLDHEQGHFDITESIAMEAQLEFAKQLASGKTLTVTAATEKAAEAALAEKFKKTLAAFDKRVAREHIRYDRVTNYSTNVNEQAAERRRQLETLRRLSQELAKVGKAKTKGG